MTESLTLCAECGGEERKHNYTPPSYSSDDGLPTFDGCDCKGSVVTDEGLTVIYFCKCSDFVHSDDVIEEDEEEPDELDYFDWKTGDSGFEEKYYG